MITGACAWIEHNYLHTNYVAKNNYQIWNKALMPSHSQNAGIPDISL